MSLVLKKAVKFIVYASILAIGFIITFFFGRQGGEYKITSGGIDMPIAYADVPYAGDGGGDGAGGGAGGDGGGAGGCGGDGDSDGDGY